MLFILLFIVVIGIVITYFNDVGPPSTGMRGEVIEPGVTWFKPNNADTIQVLTKLQQRSNKIKGAM